MVRATLSKKLRFEVFKRDSFVCQYCGAKAPDVLLQCDHIKPVVDGGSNDILNLVTACVGCNAGKGARVLSDQSTLTKQVDQLAELQTRREQLEMMIEWRAELTKLDNSVVDRLAAHWSEVCEGTVSLTPTGTDKLRRALKDFGLDRTMVAMGEAIRSYARRDEEHKYTKGSLDVAFDMMPRVAKVMKASEGKPYLPRLFYIRGILRNRLSYINERALMDLMETAVVNGADIDSMEALAKRVSSWTAFRSALENFLTKEDGDGN
jgi:HNH endonuclease